MTDPSPDQVGALFRAALDQPAELRMKYLRTECGADERLFAHVVALLQSGAETTIGRSEPRQGPMDTTGGVFEGTSRFRVLRRIGSGSFGVVYEVRDQLKNTVVALKTLQHVTSESLYRFKQEFRSLADVSHPNLVQLYELSSHGEEWFFTMELIRGRPFLSHVCRDRSRGAASVTGTDRPQSPVLASKLESALYQLLQGLDALHRSGHLHRDVKPENVLVTDEGRVVLLDFGLVIDAAREGSRRSLVIAGTPIYMSPEQAAGLRLTEASDLYSVGVMVYEALTGRPPFAGTYLEILTEKQRVEPPSASREVEGVPAHLAAICRGLLRKDPAQRPGVDDVLSQLGSPGTIGVTQRKVRRIDRSHPFVGRRVQLEALERAFDRLLSGMPAYVTISGPSGIGKSALVRAFLDRVERGHPASVILSGRCYERESVPYKALDSLVDAVARHLKDIPAHEADAVLPRDMTSVAQLFPVLHEFASRLPNRSVEPRDVQELRRRAYAGLRELLGRLGERHPLVLFVDDLQWGDIESAGLLTELIRPPDAPLMLLIAAYRDVEIETSPFLQAFMKAGQFATSMAQISVGPLDDGEAQELANALLESQASHAANVVGQIVTESGGSPFFIDELVRFAEAGDVRHNVRRGAPADTDAREATLAHMIGIRLSRLPEPAQRALRLVAVNGRPLPEPVLALAAGEPDLESCLALLRAEHLVRARETGAGVELEAYHDRTRENVISSLSADQQGDAHARLAQAFEAKGAADPELLAEHLLGAGDEARAARYTILAARQAELALAFDRAARLYRQALRLLPSGSPENADCMARLAVSLSNAGRGAEAGEAYLAVPAASSQEALVLKQKAAQQFLFAGHVDHGLTVTREVLAEIGMVLPKTRLGTLLALMEGRVRVRMRGLVFTERAAQELSADELLKIDLCWSIAAALGLVDTMRGAVFQTRHLLLALRAGELARVHRALCMEAIFVATGGRRAEGRAARIRSVADDLHARLQTPYTAAMRYLAAGVCDYLVGRWAPAASAIARSELILSEQCTGVAWELGSSRFFGLWALYELGEIRQMRARFPELLADASDRGDLYAQTALKGLLGHLYHLSDDQAGEASRQSTEALRDWGQDGYQMPQLWELWCSADIAIYQGRGRAAWRRVRDNWKAAERSLLLHVHFIRISMLDVKARAALAAAMDTPAGSERQALARAAQKCATAIERHRAPWGNALASLIRAGVSRMQGRDDEARELFSRANQALTALDMAVAAAVARRRLGELAGGEYGRQLFADADAFMRARGIRNPDRFAAMLAPYGAHPAAD